MNIEQRLTDLERSVRLWRGVTLGLLLALVVGVTVPACQQDVVEELWCRALYVVDEKGAPRIRMGVTESGPGLFLFDEEGKSRISLRISEDNRGLYLFDEKGKKRIGLGVDETRAGLGIFDEKEAVRAMLTVFEGNPRLNLYDERGTSRIGLVVLRNNPGLGISDEKGEVRVGLFGADDEDNGGLVVVLNKTDEEAVRLFADEYGNGVVGAYNRKGKGRTLKPGP